MKTLVESNSILEQEQNGSGRYCFTQHIANRINVKEKCERKCLCSLFRFKKGFC